MYLMHKSQRAFEILASARLTIQSEEVADSERVSPKIAARSCCTVQPCGNGKFVHQLPGQLISLALIHNVPVRQSPNG